MMMAASDVLVETYRLTLEYAMCGCPITHPGEQPHLVKPPFDNPFLKEHLGIQEDVNAFLDSIGDTFTKYGFPPFPCVFITACVPCIPLGLLCYYHKKRFGDIDDLTADWNQAKGRAMGLYFTWNADYHAYKNSGKHSNFNSTLFILGGCSTYLLQTSILASQRAILGLIYSLDI